MRPVSEGAFTDAPRAEFAVPPFEREFLGQSHAAVDLYGVVDHACRGLGREELGHGGLVQEGFSFGAHAGGVVGDQPRGMNLEGGVGQHPLYCLPLGQGRTENGPSFCNNRPRYASSRIVP